MKQKSPLFVKNLVKDSRRSMEKSIARFLSIIAIVALGISFFTGLNSTSPDMINSVRDYYSAVNLMDLYVQSTIGLTADDIAVMQTIAGIENVQGVKTADGFLSVNGEQISDLDGSLYTVRAISLDINKAYLYQTGGENDPTYQNRVTLLEGQWPKATNECLVDSSYLSTPDEFKIGETVSIDTDSGNPSTKLNTTEFKIVGIIRSPLYISYERGYTNIGTGKLGTFIYIPQECFTVDYYTFAAVKVAGSGSYKAYTDSYDSFLEPFKASISSLMADRTVTRANTLFTEYSQKVADGERELNEKKSTVQQQVAQAAKEVETVKDLAENGDSYVQQMKAKYNEAAAKTENAVGLAELERTSQYKEWEEKNAQYNEAKALVDQYSDAEEQYNQALNAYNLAQNTVTTVSSSVATLEQAVTMGRSAIDKLNVTQDDSRSDIISMLKEVAYGNEELSNIIKDINSMTALGTAEEISAYMEPKLQQTELELQATKVTLASAQEALNQRKQSLDQAEVLVAKLKQYQQVLVQAEGLLTNAKKALDDAEYQIQFSQQEAVNKLIELKGEISALEIQVSLAKEKVLTVDEEYNSKVNSAYAQIERAEAELNTAKQFLDSLSSASTVVEDRNDSVKGYEEYKQTADRTDALAKIFPWLFFLVAAMVCLNTMSRMVEEDRTQIGTLKALGFEEKQIMVKYVVYAVIAAVFGCAVGAMLGSWIFPFAVTKAYGILYDLPLVRFEFNYLYIIVGSVIIIAAVVLATFFAVRKTLGIVPATLMRPESPQNGGKIFLEKRKKLWSRLSFSSKVTFRNVFRNKKRFIMVIAGVMGCTALLVAGFGLGDSVRATIFNQFDSPTAVCKYDGQIALKNDYYASSGESEAFKTVAARQEIADAELTEMRTCLASKSENGKKMEINIVVVNNHENLTRFVDLTSAVQRGYYTLGDKGCLITEKMAKELKIGVGDSVVIELDSKSVPVTVTGIVKNYAFHYVYISKEAYGEVFGAEPAFNFITFNLNPQVTDEQMTEMAADLVADYSISAVAFTKHTAESLSYVVQSLNYIVLIIILAAALLAFIVLYNLSNININERFKEIATLKVLGFNRNEVSSYIARENWILTLIGTLFGLALGIPFHRLVIFIAEVDIIRFGHSISPLSFLYAFILSFLFTLIVNLIMNRHLRKINMVESLKSVE